MKTLHLHIKQTTIPITITQNHLLLAACRTETQLGKDNDCLITDAVREAIPSARYVRFRGRNGKGTIGYNDGRHRYFLEVPDEITALAKGGHDGGLSKFLKPFTFDATYVDVVPVKAISSAQQIRKSAARAQHAKRNPGKTYDRFTSWKAAKKWQMTP